MTNTAIKTNSLASALLDAGVHPDLVDQAAQLETEIRTLKGVYKKAADRLERVEQHTIDLMDTLGFDFGPTSTATS